MKVTMARLKMPIDLRNEDPTVVAALRLATKGIIRNQCLGRPTGTPPGDGRNIFYFDDAETDTFLEERCTRSEAEEWEFRLLLILMRQGRDSRQTAREKRRNQMRNQNKETK
eukprot:g13845.t1